MLLRRQPHGDLVHRESCICSVGMSDSSTWLLRSWSRKSAILVVYFEGGKAPTLFSGLGNAFFFVAGERLEKCQLLTSLLVEHRVGHRPSFLAIQECLIGVASLVLRLASL